MRTKHKPTLTRFQFEALLGGDWQPQPDGSRSNGRHTTLIDVSREVQERMDKVVIIPGRGRVGAKNWYELAKKVGVAR